MQKHIDGLGRKIARHRQAIGLTQSQLAEMADVQQETISRIETGRRAPSLGLTYRLSAALEVDLHELFRLSTPGKPKDQAMERLIWFSSRLTPEEIELVINVGAAVLGHTRKGNGR